MLNIHPGKNILPKLFLAGLVASIYTPQGFAVEESILEPFTLSGHIRIGKNSAACEEPEEEPRGPLYLYAKLLVTDTNVADQVIASEYTLTGTRVKTRIGLIGRNVSEIEVADIRNVQTHQTMLGRVLNFGDVLISTAGQSGFEIEFRNVDRPEEIAAMVRRAQKRTIVKIVTDPHPPS